jgi:hypothetical protein
MVECNTMFLTFTVEYVANKELNDLLLSNIVANILRALLGPIENWFPKGFLTFPRLIQLSKLSKHMRLLMTIEDAHS